MDATLVHVATIWTRRTVSLSSSKSKTKLSCWAIRGQPYRGLRRFISTMASMTSFGGPVGPRFLLQLGEYKSRYFRFFSAV
ncbi:MAG: hypothetical protein ACI9GW_003513 [Halieaceae bacterium]|jgi:hypothetical protein